MRRWNLSFMLLGGLVLALLGGWILVSAAAGAQNVASTARPPASARSFAGQRPATAFCNPGTINVPAGQPGITTGPAGPYPSVITVTTAPTMVVSMVVTMTNINHTFPDDIDALLVGPQGQNVMLMSDAGGSGDLISTTLTFADGAPVLPDATQISSGTYAPTNYVGNDGVNDSFVPPAPGPPYSSTLSVFNGTDPNGVWSLYIFDDQGGDFGTVSGGWCVDINPPAGGTATPTPPPPTGTATRTITPGGPTDTVTTTPTTGATDTATVTPTGGATDTRTVTPTSGATDTRTITPTPTTGGPTNTRTVTRTVTPRPTVTSPPASSPTRTATVCPIVFTDVDATNPFYVYIRCLACRQIVSGYSDGTFRWGAQVTRGQLSKIIAGAAGYNDTIPTTRQSFQDVPNSNPFWLFIERLFLHNAISGYTCGGAGEPCVPPDNRAYFRWGANATRGQISKIDAIAAGYNDTIPTTQRTFEDVPSSNPFWLWIEELATRGIISGYNCGSAGEPCQPPGNRPYFRWGNDATRGQMAKIAAQTFFPNCQTPARK